MDHPSNPSFSPQSSISEKNLPPGPEIHYGVPKDWKFWCIMFSLALSVLLTAVEFVSRHLSHAAPSSIAESQGEHRHLNRSLIADWNWGGTADNHP